MARMTPDQRRAFLAAGTRTAKLATTRTDGRPHVAPVWFVMDGDDVLFMTGADTVKGRNLRRTGQAALSVDDETPPYAFVLVEGTVRVETDPDVLARWALPISARYMGDDRAEEYAHRNAVPGELLIRVHPTNVVAEAGVAD
jgi:PPOX class probable F420-dependent enzyme